MPDGDADRIHSYAGQLVQNAHSEGRNEITIRVGDIRDALDLNYSNAVLDICQALETTIKFPTQAGVKILCKAGPPDQGLSTTYRFKIL